MVLLSVMHIQLMVQHHASQLLPEIQIFLVLDLSRWDLEGGWD